MKYFTSVNVNDETYFGPNKFHFPDKKQIL
jgi:hypothetical protein